MPTATKPPPWKCGTCRARAVVPTVLPHYEAEIDHDGRTYTIALPDLAAYRCEQCGAVVLDDAANEKISQALRRQVGLLTPEEIRGRRQELGLTQKQLACCLGIAEATLSRWETGDQIQQRSLDRFLRVLFGFPSVRAVLARNSLPEPPLANAAPKLRCLNLTPPDLLARARQFRLRRGQPKSSKAPVESDTTATAGT